jgi:hypothetical protein
VVLLGRLRRPTGHGPGGPRETVATQAAPSRPTSS